MAETLNAGQQIGSYQIVGVLGRGGMATVYRARQLSFDREVAIKVIRSDLVQRGDFLARFQREARTVASLSHAHILKVFDYGQQDDLIYLVMELLTGGSLTERIQREGALPLNTVSTILDQIASALDYAHTKGIVHRDLKPQNVLFDEAGNAFLTDFGIAKLLNETATFTQTGMAMGTPIYMAPEQWQGQPVDSRADIYALGVMIFEMLTGHVPFQADTPFALMHKHIYEAPPSPLTDKTTLPPGIDPVLRQALAKNRSDRFQSAHELVAAFRLAEVEWRPTGDDGHDEQRTTPKPYLSPAASVAIPRATPPEARLPAASRRIARGWLPAGGAIAILILGGSVLLLSRSNDTRAILAAPTQTRTSTPTDRPTIATISHTATFTPTVLPSRTPTDTATNTPTEPATSTPTDTLSYTPSRTPTSTLTNTPTAGLDTLVAATFAARAAAYTWTPTPDAQQTLNAIVGATDTAIAQATLLATRTPTPDVQQTLNAIVGATDTAVARATALAPTSTRVPSATSVPPTATPTRSTALIKSLTVTRPDSEDQVIATDTVWILFGGQKMLQSPGSVSLVSPSFIATPLMLRYRWCGNTAERRQAVLAPFSIKFYVDGIEIDQADILVFDRLTVSDRQYCRFWATLLSNWPKGEQVKLGVVYSLTDTVNDGTITYPPGTYDIELTMRVKN
ncbi:MAG TPA: protein kinase [Aggregatilineales bacterium]|nr:protein kinase [Aggregatilineales bacterium]